MKLEMNSVFLMTNRKPEKVEAKHERIICGQIYKKNSIV
jgi:hypothetical protein